MSWGTSSWAGGSAAPPGTSDSYASDPITIVVADGVTGTVLAATYGFSRIVDYTAYFTATGEDFTLGTADYTGGNLTWTVSPASDFTLTVIGVV